MTDEVKEIAAEIEAADVKPEIKEPEAVEEIKKEENAEPEKVDPAIIPDESKPLEELPLPEEEKDYEKKWPKGFKERLQRQKTQLEKEKKEADQAKAELAKLQSVLQQQSGNTQNNLEEPPKRESYSDEAAYIDALVEYKAAKKEQADKRQQFMRQIQTQQMELKKIADKVDEKGVQKYPDYDEVTKKLYEPDFPGNGPMYEAIVQSTHGEDLLYFLGNYPEKAKEIARLNPVQAIKKIVEIENRFAERKKNNATKAPKILSETPAGVTDSVKKDPNKMTPAEYREWRESQKKK